MIGEALLLRVGERRPIAVRAAESGATGTAGPRDGKPTRLGRGLERGALLVGRRRRLGAVGRPLRQRDALVGEALLLVVGELRMRPRRAVGGRGAGGGTVVVGGAGERPEAGDGKTGDDHGADDHSPGADGSALEQAGPVLLGVVHVRSCR